ncbi:unnamed protein product [Trichogramma brassicae]|uniref:PLOD1-3-like GT domain-containing protein n=1 Tax=Trichogramma brassicae TaxID=86971 RepID=A0A6H5I9P2_9HYME|nr:unnamed protein product [Trichogramma brassicae]
MIRVAEVAVEIYNTTNTLAEIIKTLLAKVTGEDQRFCNGLKNHLNTAGKITQMPKLKWSNPQSRVRFLRSNDCQLSVFYAIVFTVATNATDGFQRYIRSTEVNGFRKQVRVLGMGQAWRGGDVQRYTGGGHKVNLLKEALEPYKDDLDRVILFTDSYDVIFLKNLKVIIAKFKEWKDEPRVIFSAEEYCWPDKKLSAQYPEVARGKRYLNSGGFIGYASDIYSMISSVDIDDGGDDQLFFTKMYLDQDTRSKHNIKLDHKSEIFQNLNGASYDIELRFKGEEAYVQNTAYNTVPMILHGNGYSKLLLNSLGNYVAQSWNSEEGCISCWDNTVELEGGDLDSFPTILVALFIEKPTPFLEEFFEKISKQKYPKEKLHLLVHNKVDYHNELIQAFIEEHEGKYKSIKQIRPEDEVSEAVARDLAVDRCLMLKCSGYFSVDSEAHLDNENTLRLLVEQQRGIVAPLLVRPFKAWSNFWGAITDDGFYARSTDYMDIIHNERRDRQTYLYSGFASAPGPTSSCQNFLRTEGLWNVPFISNCYLVNATLLAHEDTRPVYEDPELDPDMSFASAYRRRNVFMYVSNRLDFGHLVNPDSYNVSLTHPDMYQLFDNKLDWEKRYIHENYSKSFEADRAPLQDSRLENGYEAVPTRDIHMTQVGLDPLWLEFLRVYVSPLQQRAFTGYLDYVRPTTFVDELRRSLSSGRAAQSQASSRQLDVHHQRGPERVPHWTYYPIQGNLDIINNFLQRKYTKDNSEHSAEMQEEAAMHTNAGDDEVVVDNVDSAPISINNKEPDAPRDFIPILDREDYDFILNRVCVQFDPDHSEFHRVSQLTYDRIYEKGHYEKLRSTRHYGPMVFYLTWCKKIDNLLIENIAQESIEDAALTIKLYYILHPSDNVPKGVDNIKLIQHYLDNDCNSQCKRRLDNTLKMHLELESERKKVNEDLD